MSRLHYLSNFLFVSVYLFIAVVLLFCISVNFVQAAPTFEEPVNYIIGDLGDGEHGGNISDAVVVDLNDDGHLDIAGAIPEAAYDVNGAPNPDQGVVTLLNDGDGGYETFSYLAFGDMPTSITSGDFDNDGDVDLATNSITNEILILSNNGTGQFTVTETYEGGIGIEKIVAADFDNDGDIDLAGSVYDATDSGQPEGNTAVRIFMNNGSGAFVIDSTILMSTPGFSRISDFVVSDFNNDENLDIVAVSGNGVSIYTVAINDGTGSFQTTVISLSILESEFVEVISLDIDSDGDEDILTVLTDAFSSLVNDGTGTFTLNQDFLAGYYENFAATDFDNDGDTDVIATYSGINEVYLFTNNGSGVLTKETIATLEFGGFTSTHVYDVNDDSNKDIIISSASQLGIWVLLQEGDDDITPTEQVQALIAAVIALDLPNSLENSYLSNLYRAETLINRDQITRAAIQLNAFIVKVNLGYTLGLITEQERNNLVDGAQQVIDALAN